MRKVIAATATFVLAAAGTSAPPRQIDPGLQFYAAPDGRADNDGSCTRPLDLATALSKRSPIRPGDTLWLRGGVYRGAFTSVLRGIEGAPITVRQAPGERAIIDNAGTGRDALTVAGSWTTWWGFEVTNTDPQRRSRLPGSWPDDLQRGFGVVSHAPEVTLVNLVLHDLANGIGLWEESTGSEAYGNVIFYNGWQGPDRAHGHGIYTQNHTRPRRLSENVLFDQFSHGIHAFGSTRVALDHIVLRGNVAFNNGSLAAEGLARDILVGGGRVARDPELVENATYGAAHSAVGYGAGCANARLEDNYFVGRPPLFLWRCMPVMVRNTLYGEAGELPSVHPENTYHHERPTGTVVRVRPNRYEPGRAHIVVYNWDRAAEVAVDLSGTGLTEGARFEIRNVQDLFGAPVLEGRYASRASVRVPMRERVPMAPVGEVPGMPVSTAPEFAVFLLLPVPPVRQTSAACSVPALPGS